MGGGPRGEGARQILHEPYKKIFSWLTSVQTKYSSEGSLAIVPADVFYLCKKGRIMIIMARVAASLK